MHGGLVDLRSDTVTRPTAAMRRAMAEAEVGDDGYGEDPTANRLERMFAERVGKEAAVFVPSGTMANQIALRLLGRAGSLVVVGRRQHLVLYEGGASAVNGFAQLHLVDDSTGVVRPDDVRSVIDAAAHHQPEPSAVFVENTHLCSGGTPWPRGAMEDLASVGLPVHLDGARLFNAEVATGVSAEEYSRPATTVMCCLSKGLGAPIGSLLAGDADMIARARAERHRLGGGMKQVGIVAAAGVVALETMIERLADDHARARRLADAVAKQWPASGLDPSEVRTNMVVFRHPEPELLLGHLRSEGVLGGTIAPGLVRLMTHLDVDDAALEHAIKALERSPGVP
jgi:threonine aldolase